MIFSTFCHAISESSDHYDFHYIVEAKDWQDAERQTRDLIEAEMDEEFYYIDTLGSGLDIGVKYLCDEAQEGMEIDYVEEEEMEVWE